MLSSFSDRTAPSEDRLQAFLRRLARRPLTEPSGFNGNPIFFELPILELEYRGLPTERALSWANIDYSLELLRQRKDCQDFVMQALLRILFRYRDSRLLADERKTEIRDLLLGTVYDLTDPGENGSIIFNSENHQIMYYAAEFLLGSLHAEAIFANTGRTGRWHARRACERILHWTECRARVGFVEWLSSCYYDETLAALLNLFDFSTDELLKTRARDLIDTLMLEMALHFWREQPGGSQGRVYAGQLLEPGHAPMSILARLCWGEDDGEPLGTCRAATLLASSGYRVPEAIAAIGRFRPNELVVRQRNSVNVEDAAAFGLRPDRVENLPFFLSAGQKLHHLVAEAAYRAEEGKGQHPAYHYYEKCRREGRKFDGDPSYVALTQADVYSFRTPDFLLGCAQAYRPGKPGFQQHVWTATLGKRAVVFTTNPAFDAAWGRPGRWHGNGILPQVLQHRNVLVAIYRVRPYPILDQAPWYHSDLTHAYFPRHAFDEIREEGGWCFGRKEDAYVALRPGIPAEWIAEKDGSMIEWRAPGHECVWICEMGSRTLSGSFESFVSVISQAACEAAVERVSYDSPSLGRVETGWRQGLRVAGKTISTGNYPRFDSPWVLAPFGSRRYEVVCGGREHLIDLASPAWEEAATATERRLPNDRLEGGAPSPP